MATWVQAGAVLTPPLNTPPFISPVLMKVGALIGGWQRKPVNQCKSWSCLKYQATVEGGDMGWWSLGGNSGVEASRSLCGIVWLLGIWGPSWFGFFPRCWVIFVYSSQCVTLYLRLGRPNVKAYESQLKSISFDHYSEFLVECFHLNVYGGYGHDSNLLSNMF